MDITSLDPAEIIVAKRALTRRFCYRAHPRCLTEMLPGRWSADEERRRMTKIKDELVAKLAERYQRAERGPEDHDPR